MSNERKTAFAFFQAISSAISAIRSRPQRSMSAIVIDVARRSRAILNPRRDAVQPPMPIWTRLVGGRVRDVGGVEERRAVHPLVEVVLRHVGVAVEVDDADVAVDVRRQAADIGVADRVVAAEDDREHARSWM